TRESPAGGTMACMQETANPLEVDLETFAKAHADGASVLDVRNPDEYETAHVPGAVLIPLGELVEREDEIPQVDPLYVICAVGGRSLTATKALVDAGYNALSVAGGTNGWIERGGEVVSGASPT
ncbi:MAG TPA: rhodanese-like domain-containing protein, partial [Acidimicrobiales bacterium]|nr:rhodanese-like domain-containing protein [Acidimicrobiales bacterium]